MRNMIIDKNFEDSYLIVGNTYDNFLFENCPNEFISIAKEKLSINSNETKSVTLSLDNEVENSLQHSLNNFNNPLQKRIICRDLISSMFLRELLNYIDSKDYSVKDLEKLISIILDGNKEEIIDILPNSPIPYDIERLVRKIGKIELNIFLQDIDNPLLQQAINNYLSSRTPYSIKVFSNKNLCTYYDQMGNVLQPPHDFLVRDINKYISYNEQQKV